MSSLSGRVGSQPHLFVVCGYVGAGKSHLVRQLRRQLGSRVAAGLHALDGSIVARTQAVLADAGYSYVLAELAGPDDPTTFKRLLAETQSPASADVRADTVIVVVDAQRFVHDFCSQRLVHDGIADAGVADVRALADVLTEQVEAADLIVLNKVDLTDRRAKQGITTLLCALNPTAPILECTQGQVDVKDVLAASRLTGPRPSAQPGWACALAGQPFPRDAQSEISTLVYRARAPFHPERLHRFLGESWSGVVRSRGFFWIASRAKWVAELSQAGAARRFRAVSTWMADLLEGRPVDPAEAETFFNVSWHPQYGDRRHEIVFVGIRADMADLSRRLDRCLLTPEESGRGREGWQQLPDPFPSWEAGMTSRSAGELH